MNLIAVLIFLIIVIVVGYLWGKNTIKKDMARTEQDDKELDKLHKLRG